MSTIQQEICLTLRYAVHFTTEVFHPANLVLRETIAGGDKNLPAKALVVLDRGVQDHHPDLIADIERYTSRHGDVLRLAGPVVIVPGGETVKSGPRHADAILQAVHEAGLCRHSYLLAIGGGAVLDVAGYAAATAHRGIRLVRMPTTVLAQDDSGVGVKNGVNAFGKKNYLGTFAPPFAVINDEAFLRTLSDRDWRSGLSEAVKAALIRDAAFFEFLERHASRLVRRDRAAMQQTIRRCAELHLAHIASGGDPFELGSSRPLDFGHWAAHRLEQLTGYAVRHGEAVAIGIALDCTYAHLAGFLPEPAWRRIIDLLTTLELPTFHVDMLGGLDLPDHPDSLLHGLEEFREHLGGRLTIALLRDIGDAFDVHDVDGETMRRSIAMLARIATEDDRHACSTGVG